MSLLQFGTGMNRIGRRQLLVGAILMASLPLSWWLFGSSAGSAPAVGLFVDKRFFGRVTVRVIDSDQDGRADGRYRFAWSRPPTRPGSQPVSYEEDRNGDGRMDVWVTHLGTNADAEQEWRYDVDTDDDGQPDWSFKTLDTLSGDQAVVEGRGW